MNMFFNPIHWGYQTWRFFFLISAVIWPKQSFKELFGRDAEDKITLLLYQLTFSSIITFGIGYLIIAYDPGTNLGLVLMGIIGKVIAAFGFIILYQQGVVTKRGLFAGAGDMLFSIFFIIYLFGGKRLPLFP